MPADGAELTFSLDHVGIDVDDLPAQIDFYRRAFDLKVELQGDGQHNVLGLSHVCLAVDDLEAGFDRLVSLGAAIRLPPIPYPRIPEWRLAYLADPEGNLVELVSRS